MELSLEEFRAIQWQGNPFEVTEHDSVCISLLVSQLRIENKPPQTVRFTFPRPRSEWAMLWDANTNHWAVHPDLSAPIGRLIVEAFAKPSHTRLILSFAGNHTLGWSRWGFSAERILVVYDA